MSAMYALSNVSFLQAHSRACSIIWKNIHFFSYFRVLWSLCISIRAFSCLLGAGFVGKEIRFAFEWCFFQWKPMYIYNVGNEKCGPLEDHSKFRQSADYLSRKSSEETRKVDGSWWFCYSWEKQYTSCWLHNGLHFRKRNMFNVFLISHSHNLKKGRSVVF